MKKLMAILMALTFVFSLAGCGGGGSGADSIVPVDSVTVDVNNPDGQAVIDYFKAAGLFNEDGGMEIWSQNHEEYWPETPVKECVGWWHPEDETKPYMMILLFDDSLADSSKEDYDEWLNYIRENKALTEEYTALRIDHLVGNIAFAYSELTLDDEDLAKIEAAYEQFIEDTGANTEF